jgi:hypothetical protein
LRERLCRSVIEALFGTVEDDRHLQRDFLLNVEEDGINDHPCCRLQPVTPLLLVGAPLRATLVPAVGNLSCLTARRSPPAAA